MPRSSDQLLRLSRRQLQVLLAVNSCEQSNPDRRHLEYHVWKAGNEMRFWGGLSIFSHLRKLTERGYLERGGNPGGYGYKLTEQGKVAIF